jgi:hypothetical protein
MARSAPRRDGGQMPGKYPSPATMEIGEKQIAPPAINVNPYSHCPKLKQKHKYFIINILDRVSVHIPTRQLDAYKKIDKCEF